MSPNLSFQDKSKLMKKALLLIFLLFFLFPVSVKATEQEVIYPQNSSFCTSFDIQAKEESDQLYLGGQVPENSFSLENASGTIQLLNNNFPDFYQWEQDLPYTIEHLLPQALKDKVEIETISLESEAKHFVLGTDRKGNEIDPDLNLIPITRISYPDWISNLLAQTKILCGLFGTCLAPQSLKIKVAQNTQEVNNYAYQNLCWESGNSVSSQPSSTQTLQTSFLAPSEWKQSSKLREEIVLGASVWFVHKDKTTTLTNETRGFFTGGSTLAQQASYLNSFVPATMLEGNAPLASKNNDYHIQSTGKETFLQENFRENIYYSGMGKIQLQRCLSLCSAYPEKFDISSVDPFCPSCDFSSYALGDVPLDMANCHYQANGACDYYSDDTSPRCDGDPVCESGKCYHNMYRQAKDYLDNGCPLPYNSNDCSTSAVCVSMNFKSNPAGGFGSCRYQNPNVCVRADRETIGRCDALCNWACCAYQK